MRVFRFLLHSKENDARVSRFVGAHADLSGDVVLASVQKLSRPEHLARLGPRDFDYVIVDEAHRSAAPSYLRVLARLQADRQDDHVHRHTAHGADERVLDTHQQAAGFAHLILVSHTPPADTVVDRTGSGLHVGSRAVRQFIERVQPDLCLTGHIHEARGTDTLGRTLVVNPGELAAGGYAVITFDGTSVGCEVRQISGGAA